MSRGFQIELTPAERELLVFLPDGGPTNEELAARLGLTVSAVGSRLHRLFLRTGLKSRVEAVAFAAAHRSCCLRGAERR